MNDTKQITSARPLSPEEVNRFQLMMVNARPTILLLLLFRLDRPVQIKEAAAIVGINRDTASDYFYHLSTHGYAAKTRDGYILTADGRQMILPDTLTLKDAEPESCGKLPHASLKTEDSIYKDSSIEILDPMRKNSARPEYTTREILEATAKAFHRPVFIAGLDIDRISPETALGWIAQAADSPKVRSPWSLVYRRLADPAAPQPDRKYLQDPERYLPEAYRIELGMMIDGCSTAGPDDADVGAGQPALSAGQAQDRPGSGEGEKVTARDPHAEGGDNAGALARNAGGDDTGPQAWEYAKTQLKQDMNRASFQAYVEPSRVTHYEAGLFTIQAPSQYAREWMESRLDSTARRLLMGICNQEVRINWEAAE
jgi:hypothetical protein